MNRVLARALRRRVSGCLYPRACRTAALLLAAALLNLSAAAPAARASAAARTYAGEMMVVGRAMVDGSDAATGQTVFPGSEITTVEKSRSFVNLGELGRLELSAETSLRLDFGGEGTACALAAGRVRVYALAGVGSAIKTADAAVSSAGAGVAVFSVGSSKGATTVVVQSGEAEVRTGAGLLRRLSAGETYTTAPKGEPRRELSDDQRKGLYVAIAAAVAVVLVVLAARGGNGADDEVFGGCIDVLSGESHCF